MTYPPVSACVFIRDCFTGAFALFESVASLLPFVSDFTIMDLGSTDGTLQSLEQIAEANPRVRLVHSTFPVIDAGAFATLANDLIAMCPNDAVLYYQSDEIWHEDLLLLMDRELRAGATDLSFWRIQYRDNFQKVKWFPQRVHRVGVKGAFNFVDDGMNSDRMFDTPLCSDYDGGWFMKWGELGQEGVKPYVNQMIMDVSLVGGFRDNVPGRRALHSPFWHESNDIEGVQPDRWIEREKLNDDWTRTESPYNLPSIMRYHVGKVRYELRSELFEALCRDETRGLLGI